MGRTFPRRSNGRVHWVEVHYSLQPTFSRPPSIASVGAAAKHPGVTSWGSVAALCAALAYVCLQHWPRNLRSDMP